MNRKWTNLSVALAVGLLALSTTGCEKLRARNELNKGVQAFKSAKYPEAVDRFKEAVRLDPTFRTARLYLATAYMSQYIPGAESEDNSKMAAAAKEHFLKVLEEDPKNDVALASMASLNFNEAQAVRDLAQKVKKLEEAQEWYKKLSEANPKNKEAFYSLGVIAWTKAYAALGSAKAAIGMKPEDPVPIKDRKIREELRASYWSIIADGIRNLEMSLSLDGDYDDAMAYLNLLYRQRADLAENMDDYRKDTATADDWLQKTLTTRKRKAGNLPAMGEAPEASK
ncbi:MAG: tetratricopeptide repeat protein [Bryobacteraceae bacterium]|jgi:tetratricopeptide (TPR) repeat protein